nr:FCD domain-containing protein [Ruegeria sp. Ofav3-42]
MRMELAQMIGTLSPITITEYHRDEARSIYENAVALRERLDSQEYVKLNQRLQTLITSLIGNHSLREFWNQAYFQSSSVWHRMEQIVGVVAYDALVQEASDLANALEREDIAAVGFVQRIYIGYGFQLIEEHLLKPKNERIF